MELVTTRRRHLQGGVSTLLALLLAFVIGSFAHAAPRSKPAVVHFDIPTGDAITTLDSFVRQSFFPALFAPEQVRGVQTNAVSGDMGAREALKKMLEGTELVIWEGDDGTWLTITRADSKEPPAASKPLDMRQQGAAATAPTDSSRQAGTRHVCADKRRSGTRRSRNHWHSHSWRDRCDVSAGDGDTSADESNRLCDCAGCHPELAAELRRRTQ